MFGSMQMLLLKIWGVCPILSRIFFLTFIITFISFVNAAEVLTYFDRQNNKIEFYYEKENNLIYSHSCVKNKKCEALIAYEKIHNTELKIIMGSDPGAIPCLEQLKGKIVTLFDKEKNEDSFCEFSDDSKLSLGAISQKILNMK